MILPERSLVILDTGHGNSVIVVAPEGIGIIDAGTGPALIELLSDLECFDISWMLLSHADLDHIGGAIAILADRRFSLRKLRLNPDSTKNSTAWDNLAYEASRRTSLDFVPALAPGMRDFDLGSIKIDVLAPSSYLLTKGAGGYDRLQRRINTNSLSAVVRVMGAKASVLLPGDLDGIGLDDVLENKVALSAATLVWPHHGGHTRNGTGGFVDRICRQVEPSLVVFSIGRTRFENPRQDLVDEIRKQLGSQVRIACTQLSKHCARQPPRQNAQLPHLTELFALGRETSETCAGTILIDLDSGLVSPDHGAHLAFISGNAPSALCCRPVSGRPLDLDY